MRIMLPISTSELEDLGVLYNLDCCHTIIFAYCSAFDANENIIITIIISLNICMWKL